MGLIDKGRMPAPLTKLFNISRSYSLWVYQWGLACCAIEMGAAFGSPRYDVMRLGVIPLPNCGGPYWDSYSVTKGVDQIIPIDVYVPGCPPRPEALLEGVVLLQQRIKNEDMQAKWQGDEFTTVQAARAAERGEIHAGDRTGRTTHDISTDPQPIPRRDRHEPIVVGGGPIE